MILCLPNGSLISVSITNGPWSRWSLLVMGSISNHISILGIYVCDRKAPGGCFSLIHHAQRENRTEIEEVSIQSKNRDEGVLPQMTLSAISSRERLEDVETERCQPHRSAAVLDRPPTWFDYQMRCVYSSINVNIRSANFSARIRIFLGPTVP